MIWQFIGKVIAQAGGAAAVAYLLFRFLGKKWIENKFSESLEKYKHKQALELQKLKIEIDSTLSGVIKMQEMEFEVLPEAWNKLDTAYRQVFSLVHPLKTYPDLDHYHKDELEEFLSLSSILETQKDRIRKSGSPLKEYQEAIFRHQLAEVKKVCYEFNSYTTQKGIFLPLSIKEKFERISREFWNTLSHKEVGKEAKDYKMETDAWHKVEELVEPLYKEIEVEIHRRLHSHGKAESEISLDEQ